MKILPLGDAALTIEWGEAIDPAIHARVLAAYEALRDAPPAGVIDLVPTYRSLTVHFDPLTTDRAALFERLQALAGIAPKSALAGRHIEIAVRFGGAEGPDLEAVASQVGRSPDEIVDTLCALTLRVYMIGFLPGFPYLGDLPEWLRLARRATPRTRVPAGSVAIAGQQAAIYPWPSPGGWHLLGRTDSLLFDANDSAQPALLAPGDTVRFVRV
jgi:KipI family sensor histidine kinase inhibitor